MVVKIIVKLDRLTLEYDFPHIYPNIAYPRRGKTRQSASDVAANRLGQVEAHWIDCLAESSDEPEAMPAALSEKQGKSGYCGRCSDKPSNG